CAVSLLIWIVTLPIQVVLALFQLLLLHESRTAEYEADRVAVRANGPEALVNGLTSVTTASNSLARGVVGGDNLCEARRKHYANLASAAAAQLRAEHPRLPLAGGHTSHDAGSYPRGVSGGRRSGQEG